MSELVNAFDILFGAKQLRPPDIAVFRRDGVDRVFVGGREIARGVPVARMDRCDKHQNWADKTCKECLVVVVR